MRLLILLLSLLAAPCVAQIANPPIVAVSDFATKAELAAVQTAMPVAATTPPPSEIVGGSVSGSGVYAPILHSHPRLTRAMTVTTTAGGAFSGTWATALALAPAIVLTPISASTSIDCQLTAAPTTTGFQGRCWSAQATVLNLSIITAGLSLNPVVNTAAGVSVQVIAIPPTQ